jgi:hypothetical protein
MIHESRFAAWRFGFSLVKSDADGDVVDSLRDAGL